MSYVSPGHFRHVLEDKFTDLLRKLTVWVQSSVKALKFVANKGTRGGGYFEFRYNGIY